MPKTRLPYPQQFRDRIARGLARAGRSVSELAEESRADGPDDPHPDPRRLTSSLAACGPTVRQLLSAKSYGDFARRTVASSKNATSCLGSDGLVRTGSGGRSTAQIFEFPGCAPGRISHRYGCGRAGLDVSTSGYYAWRNRPPSSRDRKDQMLTDKICAIHDRSRSRLRIPARPRRAARGRYPRGPRGESHA